MLKSSVESFSSFQLFVAKAALMNCVNVPSKTTRTTGVCCCGGEGGLRGALGLCRLVSDRPIYHILCFKCVLP